MDEQTTEKIEPKNASWGAIISIVVILAMIVIGAFYSWEKRVDEERPTVQVAPSASVATTTATSTQNQ